jgi:hypothetical protein
LCGVEKRIPLLHWEEGLGEEVARIVDGGGDLLSLSLSSHGGGDPPRRSPDPQGADAYSAASR